MIVPMKKVLLLVRDSDRGPALAALRDLGLVHVEISEGSGERLAELNAEAQAIESSLYAVEEIAAEQKKADKKNKKQAAAAKAGAEGDGGTKLDRAAVLQLAGTIAARLAEKKQAQADIAAASAELSRLAVWGEVDPAALQELAARGLALVPCELPQKAYDQIGDTLRTLPLATQKKVVYFLAVDETAGAIGAGGAASAGAAGTPEETDEAEKRRAAAAALLESCRVALPQQSTTQLRAGMEARRAQIEAIDAALLADARHVPDMHKALDGLHKDIEMETYVSGMGREELCRDASGGEKAPEAPEAAACVADRAVAYLSGYIPAEDMAKLRACAKAHAWGLLEDDPTEEDNVPTKLRNNKFVSLIYPLTDFLGTVPGYFEYDISGWFLGFILIFFGIIFGDGGYGLLICGLAAALMVKTKKAGGRPAPVSLLVLLFGLATVVWGTLTCTWFGIAPEQLPGWLKALSLPVISNVYKSKLWQPFWVSGDVGLTTAQNLQIFCFTLALVQLSVAHIKSLVRNRRSLKMLGDVGSILQLLGMYYVVLTLVVNDKVFGLTRVIAGVPVGTIAIALVAVGFLISFVFSNYDGSVVQSILESLKNIVSVLLGVVNIFSDIVSYIRLWAVGLAGAAISSTVNELAGPLFGHLAFAVLAVVLLVFGHGLNMILNVLSVIVHGVRLNTLEFSTHLDMSWSGHKYQPFGGDGKEA